MMREMAQLIHRRRVKDDRLGFVSVTDVEFAPDFSHAKIFVSLFGSEKENKLTWESLNNSAGYYQSELGRNLHLRQTPRIHFALDDRIAEGDRILDIIEKGAVDDASE